MDSRRSTTRGSSWIRSNAIAIAALFIALGSGAYAAQIRPNSVGSQAIQPGAVGSSEVAKGAIGTPELKEEAVDSKQLARKSVTEKEMALQSVGQKQIQAQSIIQKMLQAGSVGQQQIIGNSVGPGELKPGAVGAAQIEKNTITPAELSPAATSTLYTDKTVGPVSLTASTTIATLSLPAGTYLVGGGVQAVHNGTAASTRLECGLYQTTPAATLDYGKERLQANTGAEPIIFTKQMLQSSATLASAGTVNLVCISTNGSVIDLTDINLSALRVANLVAQ